MLTNLRAALTVRFAQPLAAAALTLFVHACGASEDPSQLLPEQREAQRSRGPGSPEEERGDLTNGMSDREASGSVDDGDIAQWSTYVPPSPDEREAARSFVGSPQSVGPFNLQPACNAAPAAAGPSVTLQISSGGRTRTAVVRVPMSYAPGTAAPLLVAFHPFLTQAPLMRRITRFDEEADARGMLVVYPNGIERSFNAGECCGKAKDLAIDDVQFTKDLLTAVASQFCFDTKRVYAAGFSNGGFMAHRLACEMSTTFAAVASVSGTLGVPKVACSPSRPVPVFHMHGTEDELVPIEGGSPKIPFGARFGTFLSVAETGAFWRGKNQCGAPASSLSQGAVSCETSACAGATHVTTCIATGTGHQWPGGPRLPFMGPQTNDARATQLVADFLLRYRL